MRSALRVSLGLSLLAASAPATATGHAGDNASASPAVTRALQLRFTGGRQLPRDHRSGRVRLLGRRLDRARSTRLNRAERIRTRVGQLQNARAEASEARATLRTTANEGFAPPAAMALAPETQSSIVGALAARAGVKQLGVFIAKARLRGAIRSHDRAARKEMRKAQKLARTPGVYVHQVTDDFRTEVLSGARVAERAEQVVRSPKSFSFHQSKLGTAATARLYRELLSLRAGSDNTGLRYSTEDATSTALNEHFADIGGTWGTGHGSMGGGRDAVGTPNVDNRDWLVGTEAKALLQPTSDKPSESTLRHLGNPAGTPRPTLPLRNVHNRYGTSRFVNDHGPDTDRVAR